MFVLPSSCRLSPVEVLVPVRPPQAVVPPDCTVKLVFSMVSESSDILVSLSSDKTELPDTNPLMLDFPGMEIPLSREILELTSEFTLSILLCGVYDIVIWSSDPISLSDQSLRVFREHLLEPKLDKLSTATAAFRIELLPSGSIIPLPVDSRISKCPYCLPNKPRKRACIACSAGGRLHCSSCRGDSKLVCPDCSGRGYSALAVAAVTSFSSAVPVITRQPCRTCNGSCMTVCPLCDGLGEVRCDTCGGSGDLRCPCSISKLDEDQFI
jgi:hypothetical protein